MMALAQPVMDATEARIGGLPLTQTGWSAPARADALSRLRAMGLPQRRDEYWKFTRPDTLNAPIAPEAALFATDETPVFGSFDRVKIVFVDGVFDADASDDLALEGVRIERLAEIAEMDIHWAKDLYGVLETRGQTPVARPFAAMNTAFATDGLVIHVTGKAAKPVSLIYKHGDTGSDAILHHVVRVEPGAELTILENGPAAARFNKCMEIDIGRWRQAQPHPHPGAGP
jgi:Fe-S cluster assembly protein SufD